MGANSKINDRGELFNGPMVRAILRGPALGNIDASPNRTEKGNDK